jgi:hypothetical protein
MKIVFIPGKYHHEAEALTPYNVYEVITDVGYDGGLEYYWIKNDLGQIKSYYYGRFVTLEKYRENLIEELIK